MSEREPPARRPDPNPPAADPNADQPVDDERAQLEEESLKRHGDKLDAVTHPPERLGEGR